MAGMTVADYRGNRAFPDAYAAIRNCSMECDRVNYLHAANTISSNDYEGLEFLQEAATKAMEDVRNYVILRRSNCRVEQTGRGIVRAFDTLNGSYQKTMEKMNKTFAAIQQEPPKAAPVNPIQRELPFWKKYVESQLKHLWRCKGNTPKLVEGLKKILERITPLNALFSGDVLRFIQERCVFDPLFRMYRTLLGDTMPEEFLVADALRLGFNRPASKFTTKEFQLWRDNGGDPKRFFDELDARNIKMSKSDTEWCLWHVPSFEHWRKHYEGLLKQSGLIFDRPEDLFTVLLAHPPKAGTPLFDATAALFGIYGCPGCKEIDFGMFFAGSE